MGFYIMKKTQERVKNQDSVPHALLYVEVVRTHEYLAADFNRLFKQHKTSQVQYNVLRILYFRGREEGLPITEIRERLINTLPDMTRIADRMVKAGLVERIKDLSDRRVVRVKITEKGGKLLLHLDQPVLKLHRKQFRHLSTSELKRTINLLTRLRAPRC
jgi:DNA-binding MarR family transcriptional regulator